MAIKGAVLKAGATSMSVVGGSDKTFTSDGVIVANGTHVSNAAETDFRKKESIVVQNRTPKVNNLGEWSKDRKTCVITVPKILASGKTVQNLIRIEREVHPESTAAEALELNLLGAQGLTQSALALFWSGGSID